MREAVLVIELYLVVVALDVLLAWVQTDPTRWPRRGTHLLTEPLQAPLRRLVPPARLDGWDVSPGLVVALLAAVRVWLLSCC